MFLRYALDVISIAILGNLIFVFLPLSPLLVLRDKFFLNLQQFGMIPFEIRTLKKRHTEKWRARRIVYNKAIVDTEAPLVRGGTEDICEFY